MDHHTLLLAQLPPVPGHNCPFFIFPQGSCCDLHESFPDTGLKKTLSSEPLHFPVTVCCSSTWKGRIRTTGVAAFGICTVPNLISNGTPEGLLGSRFPRANPDSSVFNSTIQRATRPGLTGILPYPLSDGKKPTH